jgi:hypothetical protein
MMKLIMYISLLCIAIATVLAITAPEEEETDADLDIYPLPLIAKNRIYQEVLQDAKRGARIRNYRHRNMWDWNWFICMISDVSLLIIDPSATPPTNSVLLKPPPGQQSNIDRSIWRKLLTGVLSEPQDIREAKSAGRRCRDILDDASDVLEESESDPGNDRNELVTDSCEP